MRGDNRPKIFDVIAPKLRPALLIFGVVLVSLALGTGCMIASEADDVHHAKPENWEGDYPWGERHPPTGNPESTIEIDDNEDGLPERIPAECRRRQSSVFLPADRSKLGEIDSTCLLIDGDLTVQGRVSELPELKKFDYLYVSGDVRIVETRGLTDLRAFDGLRLVGGMLDIKANIDLKSLTCMPHLSDVIGDVRVTNHPNLTSLRGFGWLQRIGGDLIIESNRSLVKLDGFPALTYIADYEDPARRPDPAGETGEPASRRDPGGADGAIDPHLIIRDNPNLQTIRGFRALTDVDGDIRFVGNPKLNAVAGFEQLEFLTGELIVRNAPNLDDLSAFDDLPCVSGLQLESTGLQSLRDLSGLHEIGEIELRSNPSLESLAGFEEMVRVRGPVDIHNNDNLTTLAGLWGAHRIGTRALELPRSTSSTEDNVFVGDGPEWPTTYREHPNFNCVVSGELDDEEVYGHLRLRDNDSLSGLGDLPLREVGGQLVIAGHDALTTLDGFGALVRARGIELAANDGLVEVRGFGQLVRAIDQIEIIDNPKLESIRGFDRLHPQSIGWDENVLSGLVFQNNPKLGTIDGFDALRELNGALAITDNPQLQTISGFSRLENVGRFVLRNSGAGDMDAFAGLDDVNGDMQIIDNDGLERLDDFQSLHRVDGNLEIERNSDLTSLIGLANLDSVDNGLYIQDNPKLPRCEAEALASSLYAPEFVVIEDNAGDDRC